MKRRILILETSLGATRSCTERLDRECAYEIRTVQAGPRAVCLAHEFGPDLLIAQVPEAGGENLSAIQTIGWVDQLPSLILTEQSSVEPILRTLPIPTRCLPPSCDDDALLGSVRELMSAAKPR